MHILLATDGSNGAQTAVELLTKLPLGASARVTVVTVGDANPEGAPAKALDAACSALQSTGAALARDHRQGHPAEGILASAEQHNPDLIVIGSHGRSAIARFLLGSVADRVARHATCSVLTVRRRKVENTLEAKRILVGLDGSSSSRGALEAATAIPLPDGAHFLIAAVVPAPIGMNVMPDLALMPSVVAELKAQEERARVEGTERVETARDELLSRGIQAESALLVGHPALSLVEQAEEWKADLVVVGSHGVSGIDRFLLGSVSEHVLKDSPCSVLIARKRPE